MRRFSRSGLTSLFTSALDFGTLAALVEICGVDYVLATWLGTVVGCLSNFLINRNWAFSAADGSPHGQLARFVPVQAGSSTIQTFGVWLLTGFAGLPYLESKLAVAVFVYLAWNYPLNHFFVFRTPHIRSPSATSSATPATIPGRSWLK